MLAIPIIKERFLLSQTVEKSIGRFIDQMLAFLHFKSLVGQTHQAPQQHYRSCDLSVDVNVNRAPTVTEIASGVEIRVGNLSSAVIHKIRRKRMLLLLLETMLVVMTV